MNTAAMEALMVKSRSGFPEKQAEVEALRERSMATPSDLAAVLENTRQRCHHMKGAFGMYGFLELYQACDHIEDATLASPVDIQTVSGCLNDLAARLKNLSPTNG